MAELFFCADCYDQGRALLVELDAHLRCEICGSDNVVPNERPTDEQEKLAGSTADGNRRE
jgi:hypothetical protein